jgi:hypothetical protein
MNLSVIKHKLKHTIRRDKPVYTFAVANIGRNNMFSVFFDFDYDANNQYDNIMLNAIECILSPYPHVKIWTKHGAQFMTPPMFSLKQAFEIFQSLKKAAKTDYFWSVPLWLRISEKLNEKGEVVSPAPCPSDPQLYAQILSQLVVKKLYRTWD